MKSSLPALVASGLLLTASSAHGYDLADGRFTIGGFGGVAAGFTDGNQAQGLGPKPGFTDVDLTLLASVRPMDELFISIQMDANPEELNLDWAFAEWRFSDRLRLRLGKVKQPFGLLGEYRDVGTLRAMYLAPEAIYDLRTEFGAFGVIGFGVNGRFDADRGWALSYDVYGGRMAIRADDMLDQIAGYVPLEPGGTVHRTDKYQAPLLGARLWVTTPIDGLSFAASGHMSFFESQSEDDPLGQRRLHLAAALSAEYLTERWMVRAEAAFLYHQGDTRRGAFYGEAGYFLTEHLEPAVRFEYSGVHEFSGPRTSSYYRHCEMSGGLSYWFNRSAVVRLEYHLTEGNLLAQPQNFADTYLAGTTKTLTNTVLVGSQFSF